MRFTTALRRKWDDPAPAPPAAPPGLRPRQWDQRMGPGGRHMRRLIGGRRSPVNRAAASPDAVRSGAPARPARRSASRGGAWTHVLSAASAAMRASRQARRTPAKLGVGGLDLPLQPGQFQPRVALHGNHVVQHRHDLAESGPLAALGSAGRRCVPSGSRCKGDVNKRSVDAIMAPFCEKGLRMPNRWRHAAGGRSRCCSTRCRRVSSSVIRMPWPTTEP